MDWCRIHRRRMTFDVREWERVCPRTGKPYHVAYLVGGGSIAAVYNESDALPVLRLWFR